MPPKRKRSTVEWRDPATARAAEAALKAIEKGRKAAEKESKRRRERLNPRRILVRQSGIPDNYRPRSPTEDYVESQDEWQRSKYGTEQDAAILDAAERQGLDTVDHLKSLYHYGAQETEIARFDFLHQRALALSRDDRYDQQTRTEAGRYAGDVARKIGRLERSLHIDNVPASHTPQKG